MRDFKMQLYPEQWENYIVIYLRVKGRRRLYQLFRL